MKLLPRLASLVAILALGGCSLLSRSQAPPSTSRVEEPPAAKVVVHVLGTPGLQFEGSLGESSGPRSIAGRVPATFKTEVREALSVRIQKTNQEGSLEIRVVVNGQEVATRSTIKPFGLVTLTYRSGGAPERPSDRSRR